MPPPQNPAGASGPGPLSRRTDGGAAQALRQLPNAKYGENSQFQALQQAASLSASPSPQGAPMQAPSGGGMQPGSLPPNPAAGQVIPFSAPTQRPNEPVTSGAALGPGPGPTSPQKASMAAAQSDMGKIQQAMPYFQMLANMPDANPSTRMLINMVNGMPGR
jgi:hypothetical protein